MYLKAECPQGRFCFIAAFLFLSSTQTLKWYYMYDQIFPPLLDLLAVLHSIPWKNKNAVCSLQISILVLEIFEFEKCVKYANEITDDVIHSTQFLA